LFTGLDGKFVTFVRPSDTLRYLYDTAEFDGNSISQSFAGITPDKGDRGGAFSTSPINFTVRADSGRQILETKYDIDALGNLRHVQALGRLPAHPLIGEQSLDPIIDYDYSFAVQTPGGWNWKLATVVVRGTPLPKDASKLPTEAPRSYRYSYDDRGNLSDVFSQMIGTLPLDRFHQDPFRETAPVPPSASSDGEVHLVHAEYDLFGNVTKVTQPNGRCATFLYDAAFFHLLTVQQVWLAAECSGNVLETVQDWDRGLERVVRLTAPGAELNTVDYDTFGRLLRLYEPDPNGIATTSALPSVMLDYNINQDGPYQSVHAAVLDGQGVYRQIWSFVDGLGQSRGSFREADPEAGDAGKWVVTGLEERGARGWVLKKFEPSFFDGDPTSDSSSIIREGATRASYDAFGRITESFNIDDKLAGRRIYHALLDEIHDSEADLAGGEHAGAFSSYERDGHGRLIGTTRRYRDGALQSLITNFWYQGRGSWYA
jgi:hypothetical protein